MSPRRLKTDPIVLVFLSLLMVSWFIIPVMNPQRISASEIATDYYKATVNTNGTLRFSNKDTGAAIVDNAPVYSMNYGDGTSVETNGNTVDSTISTEGDNVIVSSVDNSNRDVTIAHKYELNIHSPNVTYSPTITYKNDVSVNEERFDFIVPTTNAAVMTVDLGLNSFDISREYYSDLYTPKVAKFGNGLYFLGTDTMQSMRLRTTNNVDSQLSFYSDYNRNHPYAHYQAGSITELVDVSSQSRHSGDSYSPSVTFTINSNSIPSSLVKTRQPNGYDATLILTNHADNEQTDGVNAVAYGTADTSNPAYGTEGIVGRGIGWTKSVFVWGDPGDPYAISLQDQTFKTLTDKLHGDGVEIVPHSMTPEVEERTTVENGMAYLSNQYGTRNWIDHGAPGNSEDLYSWGTIKGNNYYILDLFNLYKYYYAWSYIDYDTVNNGLNMLDLTATSIRPYFYYNNNVDDDTTDSQNIYLWSTINTEKEPDLYYTNANIDSLVKQRGIHIGHEYMAYATNENHSWYTNPTTGKIEIYPAFDNELAYIQSQIQSGYIWSPTVVEAGDYWRLLPNVSIVINADGTYTVTNNNTTSISGLTLLAEYPIDAAKMDGTPILTFGGSYGAKEIVLRTLLAGQSSVLTITNGPVATTVATNAATNVTSSGATPNGNLSAMGTASSVQVSFQWGLTTAYGNETTSQTRTSTGTFSAAISELIAGATYHFRAKADGASTVYGDDMTFATPSVTSPTVATGAATGIGTTSATLNGNVTSLGAASSVRVYFVWGTSPGSYPNETASQVMTGTGAFYFDLGSLTPGIAYYYQAGAAGDGTSYGGGKSFTTSTTPPAVATNDATSITTNSAQLNGNLTSLGTASSVTVSFVWGTTSGSLANETVGQIMTGTGAFSFDLGGLALGTMYYYQAKAVGDGTSYGAEMSFTTRTVPPAVATNGATNVATTSATLNGDLDATGTASSITVSFAWGTAAGGAYTNPVTISPAMTAPGAFSAPLSGLAPKTTYYYIARAVGDGTVDGVQMSFTTSTITPSVTTNDATNIAATTVTLNGDLTAKGTADNITVSFEYGTTSGGSYTAVAAGWKDAIGTFSVNLSGLTPGATYCYRAVADGDGDPVYGLEKSFTSSTTAPTVTTSAASNLAATSATLNGNLGSLGTATSVTASFQWGTTTSYGSETSAQSVSATGAFSANLTGLTANTTYHFRAKAVGHGAALYGMDMIFSTADTIEPVISAVNSTDITKTGATITWSTNEAATSQVEYGLTEEYGSSTTLDTNLVTSHSVDLTGLKARKTYHYRVVSRDASNNQAVSADETFTTTTHSGAKSTLAWPFMGLAALAELGVAVYFRRTDMVQEELVRRLEEAVSRADLFERERDESTATLQSMKCALTELRNELSLFRSKAGVTLRDGPAPDVSKGQITLDLSATSAPAGVKRA